MPHLDERVTPSEWTVLLYTGPSLAQQDQKLIDELLRQVAPSPNVCFVYQLNSYDRSVRGAITNCGQARIGGPSQRGISDTVSVPR